MQATGEAHEGVEAPADVLLAARQVGENRLHPTMGVVVEDKAEGLVDAGEVLDDGLLGDGAGGDAECLRTLWLWGRGRRRGR